MQLGRSVDESGKEQPNGIHKLPAPPGQTTIADVYARLKYEHQKEYITYKREKRKAISKLDIPNAIWFSTASLLQQGGEHYPRALSARIPTVLWWMAIMVFVATYTANMAAFLTADRLTRGIETIEDLGGQSKVHYGVTDNSATSAYFQNSQIQLYSDMYTFMRDNGGLIPTTAQAFTKVHQSTNPEFVYIGGSLVVQYEALTHCDVYVVGPLFAKTGYGLAFPQNSPYTSEFNRVILHLRETGFMDDMYKKWLTDRGDCPFDPQDTTVNPTDYRVGVRSVIGVFYIIIGGMVISVFLLIVEWLVFPYVESKKYIGKRNSESFIKSFMKQVRRLEVDIKNDWFPRLPYCIRPEKPRQQTTQVAPQGENHLELQGMSAASERMVHEWRLGTKAPTNTDINLEFSEGQLPSSP